MLRALAALLCAFLSLPAAQAQYLPGYAPGFRPGQQLLGGLPTYDFANGATIPVTRASVAYAANTAGNFTAFAANIARITNSGLTYEGAQTNSVANSAMQGAAAGTPGTLPSNWSGTFGASGLTQTIIGTSARSGLDCIDVQVSGTTSAAVGTILYFGPVVNQASTAPGQIQSLSAFSALIGGSFANVGSLDLAIRENDSANAFLRQTLSSILGATGTLSRFVGSATMGASTASVATGIRLGVASGAAINFTLRVCAPQLERRDNYAVPAAGASSPIRNAGTSVPRAADAASITVPSGAGHILYTFDDGSTQTVSVSPGAYTIPASLNRSTIARMQVQP
jgi:hypothetical protein